MQFHIWSKRRAKSTAGWECGKNLDERPSVTSQAQVIFHTYTCISWTVRLAWKCSAIGVLLSRFPKLIWETSDFSVEKLRRDVFLVKICKATDTAVRLLPCWSCKQEAGARREHFTQGVQEEWRLHKTPFCIDCFVVKKKRALDR